jgi:hypothetical protein
MNRHCCFIFDYDNDLARAKQINDLSLVRGTAPAGFDDASRWREARNAGEEAVRGLIDGALSSTSATIVLIGEKTADLDYVAYAIEQSISRQNGIVGFFVHDMPDENSKTSTKGKVPYEVQAAEKLDAHHYDVHDWDQSKFEEWVEEAATEWKIYARPEPLRSP